MPERDGRRLAVVAAHFVRVRRAELALHLPDEIGQFAARGHAVEQRRITFVDGVPVDARHVRRPEVIALQPPDFAQHLPPFAARVDRHPHASQVDPAALARRRVRLHRRICRLELAVGGNGAQSLAFADHQRRGSSASTKRSTLSSSVSARSVSKSKSSSRPGASLWPPRPCAPTIGSSVQIALLPATPAIWP